MKEDVFFTAPPNDRVEMTVVSFRRVFSRHSDSRFSTRCSDQRFQRLTSDLSTFREFFLLVLTSFSS